jgi:hypothetical protein
MDNRYFIYVCQIWNSSSKPLFDLSPTSRQGGTGSPPRREGLDKQQTKSPSLPGEGDLGGEVISKIPAPNIPIIMINYN